MIVVTNRRLCTENFFVRLEKIARARPYAIILREKDLTEKEYFSLAEKTLEICKKHNIYCILHNFTSVAEQLGAQCFHAPFPLAFSAGRKNFELFGVSCHSAAEAVQAQKSGAKYVTAGHIFQTDCKKGVPARGLEFLREVAGAVDIPVYAIGGITPQNYASVLSAGAAGACVMSGAMTCPDPEKYLGEFGI